MKNCRTCANRRTCNNLDRYRDDACKDYVPGKLKKLGYGFMVAGALGIFVLCSSEFEKIYQELIFMAAAGLAALVGAILLGGDLDDLDEYE